MLALLAGAADAATIRTVALTGGLAPDAGGAVYSAFGNVVLNNEGETAFRATLAGEGVDLTNDVGVFTSSALVLRAGDAAPGLAGLVLAGNAAALPIGNVSINSAGDVAFGADLAGPGVNAANRRALFTSDGLVVRAGDAASGVPDGIFSSGLGHGVTALSDEGVMTWSNILVSIGAVNVNNNAAIFSSEGLVAREDEVAPGAGGAVFARFATPSISAEGHVVFQATLRGDGVGAGNAGAIFSSEGLIVRAGDVAPGTDGAVFAFLSDPQINAGGEVVFTASLAGAGVLASNDAGLFTTTSLVAREGGAAPGVDGALFASFLSQAINDGGATAFVATFAGAGVTAANNRGLFMADGLGGLELVLRTGDLIEAAAGDLRTLTTLFFAAGGMNNRGDLAFLAGFSDGSAGLFVIERGVAAAVPLPGALGFMLVGLAALGLAARRRSGAPNRP